MVARPDAEIIFLRQIRVGNLELNQRAFQQRANGCVLFTGDRISAYQVGLTVPEGPVVVTGATRFVFAS